MLHRAAVMLVTLAAASAAATLAVFAAGFALYAYLQPVVGVTGASALVAAAAALCVLVFALVARARARARGLAIEAEASNAALRKSVPLALTEFARERPILALVASVLGGAVSTRFPGAARDLIALTARVTRR